MRGQHQLHSWEKVPGEVTSSGWCLTRVTYAMGGAEAKSLYGTRLARLFVAGGLVRGVEQCCTLDPGCRTAEVAISVPKMLTKCS
jgi:hypothetical protein